MKKSFESPQIDHPLGYECNMAKIPKISRPLAADCCCEIGVDDASCWMKLAQLVHLNINDHTSFLQIVEEERLRIPPMAKKCAEIKKSSPQRISIVDFETVRRSQRGLRLCPTEVTVRDGEGRVIISCAINDEGVTNAQFEARLKSLGYDDAESFKEFEEFEVLQMRDSHGTQKRRKRSYTYYSRQV